MEGRKESCYKGKGKGEKEGREGKGWEKWGREKRKGEIEEKYEEERRCALGIFNYFKLWKQGRKTVVSHTYELVTVGWTVACLLLNTTHIRAECICLQRTQHK